MASFRVQIRAVLSPQHSVKPYVLRRKVSSLSFRSALAITDAALLCKGSPEERTYRRESLVVEARGRRTEGQEAK